ncbi:hypothetical protein [Adoxophyes orana nucleopolyhedrovirus]|uniref:hypothetical protein n=1 Tax=Adoxophyes orana nucleopolyhedrovirus TaxID=542343 RepID=UPI0001829C36|nr:hypothetical protein [Adoxophyes orana nucleopolyhedrovirus]ACF05395.1 hypothetical protein [Adoxophyes orana nucleopolyhedrovirus]
MIISLIVLFFILFILYIYCSAAANNLLLADYDNDSDPLNFIFDQNGMVNCNQTRLPCVTNRQCLENCNGHNILGTMICEEGFCVSRDAYVSGRPDDFECDSSLGLITVYVASEFIINKICISMYRELVDDLGTLRPYVCENGQLNIELSKRQFTPDDCVCDNGFTKMIFNQTALARAIPVCINNSSVVLFNKVYNV